MPNLCVCKFTNLMTDKYYSGRGGILSLISQRELGSLSNCQYKDNAVNIKVNQIPKIFQCTNLFANLDDAYYWYSLRSNAKGDLIGVCTNCSRRRHSSVCVCKFTYNVPNEDADFNGRSFIKEITKTYQVLQNMVITDTADLSFRNQKPLLIVGTVRRRLSEGGVAFLSTKHCDYAMNEYEWRVKDHIFCCASVLNSANFALGCANGFYICKHLRLSKKYNLQDNVCAAEFNDNGNLLFISSDQTGIQLCDMREDIERCCRNSPSYIKQPALSNSNLLFAHKMKLLSDQVTLVVSDTKGFLSKVDLRMKRSVFQYPEHVSSECNRPLNIDEDLDLLCAVGNDNYCRIWSLSSGKLNWSNGIGGPPALYGEPPVTAHACIVSSERRWFVAAVQNDTVIPFVPSDAGLTYDCDVIRLIVNPHSDAESLS